MATYRVASERDLEDGSIRFFEVSGRDIALAKSGGAVYAFDDTCTHAGCSLSEGELSGTTITCPCHGGVFDITTGEVVEGPPPEPIETYPISVSEGEISIEIED
jgi:nitrite reductase/ring-hydroxylating ferredoxin subunit